MQNILIIKHGALGDVILATAAFAAIRAHHPQAKITLLTTQPYADLLSASPYFDEIWIDKKPRLYNFYAIRRLYRLLNQKHWDFVYDLQTSERSSAYWWLFKRPRPPFCGVGRRHSHRFNDPTRRELHALDHDRSQLAITGIHTYKMPDISWLKEEFPLPRRGDGIYALIVPGGAAHRPEKRWPIGHFIALALILSERGITPVLLGTESERIVLGDIAKAVPAAINLCGKTSIAQIASLAREAIVAVGNDTGPMHVIAAAGCSSLVLFSGASDPTRSAPMGTHVRTLQRDPMANIQPEEALAILVDLV
ncbi:MAG: glycosyltransferase family 9 protein [Alphaproteobacteria bacterium]